jgi:predicted dehydrogenase
MTLRIGIIGTGGISNSHVRGYQANGDLAQIVAVADINKDRAEDAAHRWGVDQHFTDYRSILDMKDVDAVSVCTFNQAHRQPTVDALAAGKHVLCEKPMAATLADAIAMKNAAETSGRILMIAIHSRYSPHTIAAKMIFDSGTVGRVYYGETISTRRRWIGSGSFARTETAGGGAVVDIGVYSLDTALHLLGHPKPKRVSGTTCMAITKDASAKSYGTPDWDVENTNVEEFGAAWIRFEGGLCLTFKTSWAIHGNSMGRSFFLGEKGGLALGPLEYYADQFGMMVNVIPQDLPAEGDRFALETRDFLECVRDGKPSPIPPEQVIATNAIMDALYRSAAADEEVEVAAWE